MTDVIDLTLIFLGLLEYPSELINDILKTNYRIKGTPFIIIITFILLFHKIMQLKCNDHQFGCTIWKEKRLFVASKSHKVLLKEEMAWPVLL